MSAADLIALGIVTCDNGRAEQRVACPQCAKSERDTTLGVNVDTGVYHCFRCDWSGRAGSSERPVARRVEPKPERPTGDTLARIWARTVPLAGTIGETYLQRRMCAIPPADGDLRYLPSSEQYPPSLCGLVTDATTGAPLSLHFTPINADLTRGDRRYLSGHPLTNGVIRLWPDESVTHGLAIGEGIETTLSLAHDFSPVWAALDSGHLKQFPVLAGVEYLTIIVDADDAGIDAAAECAERWMNAGREIALVTPSRMGADLNDEVLR